LTRETVGEAGVDHGRRLVDPAAERRHDAVDHPEHVRLEKNRPSVSSIFPSLRCYTPSSLR
jgi:hypothetical protein